MTANNEQAFNAWRHECLNKYFKDESLLKLQDENAPFLKGHGRMNAGIRFFDHPSNPDKTVPGSISSPKADKPSL